MVWGICGALMLMKEKSGIWTFFGVSRQSAGTNEEIRLNFCFSLIPGCVSSIMSLFRFSFSSSPKQVRTISHDVVYLWRLLSCWALFFLKFCRSVNTHVIRILGLPWAKISLRFRLRGCCRFHQKRMIFCSSFLCILGFWCIIICWILSDALSFVRCPGCCLDVKY